MTEPQSTVRTSGASRAKFIIGGALIIAAVIYLIVSSLQASAQYYMTVGELEEKMTAVGNRELRISGAVIGDSIYYDAQNLRLEFTIAHIPGDQNEVAEKGGLAAVLHAAVNDPSQPRLKVVYHGVMPDLMQNEAQAIVTGKIGADGVFQAEELLLKCPTRYEEAVPDQAVDG
ncbi:MAG: cytochrome c maturation protein CcmE [Chloroflexota bacterium]|jgi:cytochrome c-type biogenesis protein CcmE